MNKSAKESNRRKRESLVDPSPFIRIAEVVEKYPNSIKLNSATAHIELPPNVRYAISEFTERRISKDYGPILGLLKLREAVSQKLLAINNIRTSPENIVVTLGAQEAFVLACRAVLEPGDYVLMFSPTYPNHPSAVELFGGKTIYIPLKESNNWGFDFINFANIFEEAKRKYGNRLKALVICNPLNPTGSVLTEAELRIIAKFALDRNIWIITDEAYEYYYFGEQKHFSLGQLPEVFPKLISCFSFSKTFALPGIRIGYLVAEKSIIPLIETIHENLAIHVPETSQYIAMEALSTPNEWFFQTLKEISTRRNILISAINEIKNLSLTSTPSAGLCCFPKFYDGYKSIDFIEKLAREAGVIGMPGSGFGLAGEQHIRLSFGVTGDILCEAIERLKKWSKMA